MNLEQIDTSTTAGKAEVMRLAAEGRKLVFRVNNTRGWEIHCQPMICSWNWVECQYAIISEPVGPEEVWVAVKSCGTVKGVCLDEDEPYLWGLAGVRYIRADLAGEAK